MAKTEHVIASRAITSGKNTFKPGRVVTAKVMGLTDEHFKTLVTKGHIVLRPVAEVPVAPAGGAPKKVVLPQIERYEKIADTITSLYGEDGKPINQEDFTEAGLPAVEALETLLLKEPGFEDGISAPERDAGVKMYLENLEKNEAKK